MKTKKNVSTQSFPPMPPFPCLMLTPLPEPQGGTQGGLRQQRAARQADNKVPPSAFSWGLPVTG